LPVTSCHDANKRATIGIELKNPEPDSAESIYKHPLKKDIGFINEYPRAHAMGY